VTPLDLCNSRLTTFLKQQRNCNNIFETRTECLLEGPKELLDKGGGGAVIAVVDEAQVWWSIRFQLDSLVGNVHSWLYVYWIAACAGSSGGNYYVSRGGPVQQIWRHDMYERRKQLTQTYPTRKKKQPKLVTALTLQWKCPRTMGTTGITCAMKERKLHKCCYALQQTIRNLLISTYTHAFVISRNYSKIYIIQGEHKNTPWFEVVIKSKLTGIFL